ncbi:MAG TPA: beta-ketoacyl-ACP synthase III [Gemmatimonadales bacterium]
MITPRVHFAGLGAYTPERVITNAEFEATLETSDTWIRERTGIRERHVAAPGETTAMMSANASRMALEEAEMSATDLDTIILATASPDRLLPSTACDLQALLGATQAKAFDVSAACSGWLYALVVGEAMIAAGTSEKVLVLGAEKLTSIMDWQDRSTAVLFGDGAGAAVLTKGDGSRGIVSSYLKSDGTLAELLWRPGGGANCPPSEQMIADRSYYIKMAGREVFKNAVRSMADAASKALDRAGITGDQVDLLVPHQANLRIIEATANHAHIPMDRVYVNVDRFGNTSSASIPIALEEARRCGRIKPGMTVLLVTFGAGFTWGSMVLKW